MRPSLGTMCRHDRWLDVALKVAAASPYRKWRVGAVVVRGGSVLAVGMSKSRNDPSLLDGYDEGSHEAQHIRERLSLHAEIDALSRCTPEGADLYVARLTPAGATALAKPCRRCAATAEHLGVRHIRWTE